MFCSTCGESLQVSFKFCPKCGKDLAANLAHESCDVDSQKNIIETYFLAGFFSFLEKFHDIHISLLTLKRRLRDCGFKGRSSADLNQNEVRKIIKKKNWMAHAACLGTGPCSIHFTVNNFKQTLMEQWSLIQNQPLLKAIYLKRPIISYKRGNL